MKLARLSLTCVAVILLLGGYLASQFAAFSGQDAAFSFAAKVDAAPIRFLALILLLAAVVMLFIPEREHP